MRLWSNKGHVFQVEVNDTHHRHGCNHTITTNSFDSEMQEHTTPALHACLKVFIQRTVFKARTSVAWSSMQEDAVNMCKASCHLHCRKGHAPMDLFIDAPDAKTLKKYLSQPSCKHAATIGSFLGSLSAVDTRRAIITAGFPQREYWPDYGDKVVHQAYFRNLEVGPAHTEVAPQYYRFLDLYSNIASQVLTGGERTMHASVFAPELDRQAERYVRRWNRILYHRADCQSDMQSMWTEFANNNLCVRLLKSIAPVPPHERVPLDMYSWSLIGMVYEQKVVRKVASKKVGKSSSRDGKSWTPPASAQAENGSEGYHYVSVYASVASLLWYVISFLKVDVMGWQQTLMDVVHEVGANVGNLNLYNVGVTDMKQTCCHAAVAVHSSRKGLVFESTSAALNIAAEFVHEHLSVLAEIGSHFHFDLAHEFALEASHFPAAEPVTTRHRNGAVVIGIEPEDAKKRTRNDGPQVPLDECAGRTVTCHLAFPLRPPDSPSFFPEITPGECPFGACTDGDFTMWHRHILHIPQRFFLALLDDPVPGAMGLRYCDKHKGTLIRDSEKKMYAEWARIRKPPSESPADQQKTMRIHDKKHALGGLMSKTWTYNFEEILGVIRAHPHAGVARLFLSMKSYKAAAMGLTKMLAAFKKNHSPLNISTGVYGQSTFASKSFRNDGSVSGKMGVGFTANCLEAGANASLKRALGMQSSLPVINGVVMKQCRLNALAQTKLGFSVRQDYTSKSPRACSKRYKQMNEEDTGAFFHAMWKDGQEKARNTSWVEVNVRSLNPQTKTVKCWADTSMYLPTKYGMNMALAMDTYTELDMYMVRQKTQVKKPEKTNKIYGDGTACNLRSNLARWKRFMADPEKYLAPDAYDGLLVVDGRRELADPKFVPSRGQTKVMTALESYHVYEKTLLFYQHAYVHVTANPNVLTAEQATTSMPESWRTRKVCHATIGLTIPVDFGCFRCTCRQHAKYGFCEHCIIVGTLQREGDGLVCQNAFHCPLVTCVFGPTCPCASV